MAAWHRGWRADIGLRMSGLGLGVVSWLAGGRLSALAGVPFDHAGGAIALVVATIVFLAGSAGAALACWGAHLFDEIEVGERWRRRPAASASPLPSATDP